MSEEPTSPNPNLRGSGGPADSTVGGETPRLRLKSRLVIEPAATADGSRNTEAPTGMAGLGESHESVPIIKLRPRALTVAPVDSASSPGEIFSKRSSVPPPPMEVTPFAPASDAEFPGIQSTPPELDGLPSAAQLDSATPVPENSGAPKPPTLQPFPVMAPPIGSSSRPPPVIHIRAPLLESDADSEKVATATPFIRPPLRRRPRIGTWVGGGVLLLVLGGVAFLTYQHYVTPASSFSSPPPRFDPAKGAAGAAGPTPSETLNALAAAPGKLIGSAQDAIAARRNGEQSRVDGILDGTDPAAKSASRAPGSDGKAAAGQPPAMNKMSATATLAPGLSVTTEIQASKGASAAFRSFVAEAKVTGVFQGSPARANINGRLVREGQSVDEGLAITFDGIDAEKRMLFFKDRTGGRVSKRY